MNADGSNETRLRPGDSDYVPSYSPAWSPGASRILFQTYSGGWEIYAMDTDGSNLNRLTFNEYFDESPAWSADGARIAFHTDRDGNFEIYAMNANGSGQTRLTFNETADKNPAWSP